MVIGGKGTIGEISVRAGNTLLLPASAPDIKIAATEPLVLLISQPTLAAC
jgi:hypothetical protein